MDEAKILTKQELKLYDEFSINFNQKTKRDYLMKIIQFKKFLNEKYLLEVDKEECNKFMENIKENYAKSTSEKIYSYLHSFYSFLSKNKYMEINPFSFVQKPLVTREKGKDDVLSIQEINKLIDSLYKLNARDRLIMVFLTTTGCMLNELVAVKWKDLIVDDKDNYYIKLGKGKKERIVKLHPYCFRLIEDYRYHSGLSEIILPTDEFIFTTQKSNSITDRNVRIIVHKAFDLAGLKNYSAKDLRHSYAAISLMLGADREDIKKQLGWSDKYYAIRYKNVIDFVDSESIDYMMQKENMNINKK